MPFWWRRRKRRWYGTWNKRRYFTRHKRRKRRFPRRYRRRRFTRRRRRRRGKVRRKKKTLTVRQYQPDCIRKCKIKGIGINILGAQGKQFACYTDNSTAWTPPLQPGGGGFGVEKFTFQYLYEQNKAGNNIWTASNKNLDLVRYTGGYIKFWRHQHADFIVRYDRTLPMTAEKYTYPETYPQSLLLGKHKRIIPSLNTQPKGKRYVKIKFKPPKMLTNKWFFQEALANTGLIKIQSSVADLRYPHMGCCNTNELVTISLINMQFYKNFGWGNSNNPVPTQANRWYQPYNSAKTELTITLPGGKKLTKKTIPVTPYNSTILLASGWFQPDLMQAIKIEEQTILPTAFTRYNPTKDTGVGNQVWLASVISFSIQPPKSDKDLIIEGLPLYQLLFGFLDMVQKKKGDTRFLDSYCLFFKTKFAEPQNGESHIFCPIDDSFRAGKGAYDSYPTQWDQEHWFPTVKHQLKTINNIVMSGPFIPKLENIKLSTWELWCNYCFYFKFGGATLPDAEADNPQEKGTYPVPTNQQQTVQVTNPQKSSPYATLHSWDFRRGVITSSAYKRMCENQETDTEYQTDTEPPKKKKTIFFTGNSLQVPEKETQEIQTCLQSLCETNSCQESEEEKSLHQLIKEQQQQQQHLKHNLLKLIVDLKNKQKLLQLQTGVLE
nr:MAG: ORF1 [Torque teno midi virus]